jgi:ABC-type lipoprotein export system ATPase subunit
VYDGTDQIRALDGVDLAIRPGEFVAIVGPSGSGKSTLLHMLGALDRPTSGDVLVGGQALSAVRDLDGFRSRTVGFVFQTHNLIPTLTARENVEVPMQETTRSAGARRARSLSLLELVGLRERADALPAQLSGGQKQRVAIARALANQPTVVLADEPTGNLDSRTTADVLALLTDLNRSRGVTLIVVTHNPQVARAASRVVTLRDGRVQLDVRIGDPLLGDLYEWRASTLGQAILSGDPVPDAIAPAVDELRDAFKRV